MNDQIQNDSLLNHIKRLQAIAQTGLAYTENPYDIERYEELREMSISMMQLLSMADLKLIRDLFASGEGYPTPMVDVRAAVFQEGRILMVREKADNLWSLPGGWADIGYTPAEVAVKEVREEAGLEVEAVRLMAIWDKKMHPHPPQHWYVYKICIQCEIRSGQAKAGFEASDVGFFSRNQLPPLSKDRILKPQIERLFDMYADEKQAPIFD